MSVCYFERKFAYSPFGLKLDKKKYVVKVVPKSQAHSLKVQVGWKVEFLSTKLNFAVFSQSLPPQIKLSLRYGGLPPLSLSTPIQNPFGINQTVSDLKKSIAALVPGNPSAAEITLLHLTASLDDSLSLCELFSASNEPHLELVFSPVFLALIPDKPLFHQSLSKIFKEIPQCLNIASPTIPPLPKLKELPPYSLELRNSFRSMARDRIQQENFAAREVARINLLPGDFFVRLVVLLAIFGDSDLASGSNAVLLAFSAALYLYYSGIADWLMLAICPLHFGSLRDLRRRAWRCARGDLRSAGGRWDLSLGVSRFLYGFFASLFPSWSPEDCF